MISKLLSLIGDGNAAFISSKSNIFYYSGFTSEDAKLFISKDKRYIITDNRYFVQAKIQSPDFEIFDIANGYKSFFELIGNECVFFEEDNVSTSLYRQLVEIAPKVEFKFGADIISQPRQVKTESEVNKILQAEKLGDEAFSHILNFIKPGISEKDIALELEFYMRKHGASGLSFETIVASGLRGAMPHGTASDKLIKSGELVTLDFGCVLDHYCSDMTRTVAVGSVCDELKYIYDVVLKAQLKALHSAKSGMTGKAIDALARDVINDAGYGKSFGHTLGHSLGLDIHERPLFSPKNNDHIVANNVVTFEPGIYIEGLGGVRIEDVGLVTETGVINLTSSPKELIVL